MAERILDARGHSYSEPSIWIAPFANDLGRLFPKPDALIGLEWPPTQVAYLSAYLKTLDCRTVVVESQYIDRDWVDDVSLFYSRSLRSYTNACQRLHFFRNSFDEGVWNGWIERANGKGFSAVESELRENYLGFSVIRPLAVTPIGRTVVPPLGAAAASGAIRTFDCVRDYDVHLAGFSLRVRGLAFQQQDRGVSACATTALWTALHRVAFDERMTVPTPAAITEAASRFIMEQGRTLPAEGLSLGQMAEAAKAFGLAPLVVPGRGPEIDRTYLATYTTSGFPPVLAIVPRDGDGSGHAITCTGLKCGPLPPQLDTSIPFRDSSSSILSLYVHDDRLGPYAVATPSAVTDTRGVRTGLSIKWPDEQAPHEESRLIALIIPVPAKLRLTLQRLRETAVPLAAFVNEALPSAKDKVVLSCRYERGVAYQARAFGFGLSADGIRTICTRTPLSRYVGLAEISIGNAPLFDVVVDATESHANPSILAVVRRGTLAATDEEFVAALASLVNAKYAR